MPVDDEKQLYWWRFLWSRYVLVFVVILSLVGGVYALRQARVADNVGVIGGYFRQADAIDP